MKEDNEECATAATAIAQQLADFQAKHGTPGTNAAEPPAEAAGDTGGGTQSSQVQQAQQQMQQQMEEVHRRYCEQL